MAEPTPILDEDLLDQYALIFARMALDRLIREAESQHMIDDEAKDE